MGYQNELDVAIGTIRSSFNPYGCDVRLYDNGRLLSFLIPDSAGKVLHTAAGIPVLDILDPVRLRATLEQARDQLALKACRLASWSPPN
jgi:hypothetical protein